MTGRVGVCIATSGPGSFSISVFSEFDLGATNLVTGLADALLDSVPIVAITGQVDVAFFGHDGFVKQVPRRFIGTDAFQETPIVEVSRQITKHNYLVMDVNDIPRIVKEAFFVASTGPKTRLKPKQNFFD